VNSSSRVNPGSSGIGEILRKCHMFSAIEDAETRAQR
jgi:hypothetical protein